MAPTQAQFKGYAVKSPENWSKFEVVDFKPKTMEDYDIEIATEYCGVCGSDVHTISGGWGEWGIPKDSVGMITGHEVAGIVTRVGSKVTEFKAGDKAGVGAQVWACGECDRCKSDNENYCAQQVDTYNAVYSHAGAKDEIAHGGYSSGIRAHEKFVFKIPDGLELEQAAAMMCGGLTAYSPLVRNGCGPGKKVGVVGIGGLGHYALQWAKALGADEVVAISHSESKKEDALKMGADKFVLTGGADEGLKGDDVKDLDIIINTVDLASAIPLKSLFSILAIHGIVISVGLPNEPLPSLQAQDLAANGAKFGVTHIGSKKECNAMLKLAVDKNVRTWVMSYPMKDAGKAVEALKGGAGSKADHDVRYRQVLKQDLVQY